MDAWWPGAAKKARIGVDDMEPLPLKAIRPLIILAVNAPDLSRAPRNMPYDMATLSAVACRVSLIFGAAEVLLSTVIYSGLLGGGAFRGNRQLMALLHLVALQRFALGLPPSDCHDAQSVYSGS